MMPFLRKLVERAPVREPGSQNAICTNGVLDMFLPAVLDHGLAARYLLQMQARLPVLTALEAVEAVSAVAIILQARDTFAQLLDNSRAPVVLDDFSDVVMA